MSKIPLGGVIAIVAGICAVVVVAMIILLCALYRRRKTHSAFLRHPENIYGSQGVLNLSVRKSDESRPDSGDTTTSFIDVSQIAARNAGGRISYDRPYSDLYSPDINVQTKPVLMRPNEVTRDHEIVSNYGWVTMISRYTDNTLSNEYETVIGNTNSQTSLIAQRQSDGETYIPHTCVISPGLSSHVLYATPNKIKSDDPSVVLRPKNSPDYVTAVHSKHLGSQQINSAEQSNYLTPVHTSDNRRSEINSIQHNKIVTNGCVTGLYRPADTRNLRSSPTDNHDSFRSSQGVDLGAPPSLLHDYKAWHNIDNRPPARLPGHYRKHDSFRDSQGFDIGDDPNKVWMMFSRKGSRK